jgi:hypothetical protein
VTDGGDQASGPVAGQRGHGESGDGPGVAAEQAPAERAAGEIDIGEWGHRHRNVQRP